MAVPLIDVQAHRPRIGTEIDAGIARVVEHGKWIMGPEVAEFEEAMQAWVSSEGVQALGCSNGTDALVLALQALEIKAGDAVICPSFTFIATAEAVAMLGGVPVFADVADVDFNIDPASVRLAGERAAQEGLNVVGIIAVDLFGHPADYQGLRSLADEMDWWIIGDGAQSFGASTGEQRVGAMADITTTSFFPAKPLGCYGDGGAVFTANDELAAAMRSLRVHGKGSDKYDNVRIGQNSRLDTIQAAILLPKLAILGDELDARNAVAERYAEALGPVCTVPTLKPGVRSAWAQYTIRTDRRAELQAALSESSIGSAVYYPTPLHRQTAYASYHTSGLALEKSDELAETVLSLPMFPYLSTAQQDEVIEKCLQVLGSQ